MSRDCLAIILHLPNVFYNDLPSIVGMSKDHPCRDERLENAKMPPFPGLICTSHGPLMNTPGEAADVQWPPEAPTDSLRAASNKCPAMDYPQRFPPPESYTVRFSFPKHLPTCARRRHSMLVASSPRAGHTA